MSVAQIPSCYGRVSEEDACTETTSLLPTFKKKCSLTADQLRWPVQVGVAGALASLIFTFLPASERFFGTSGIIGTAVTVAAIECTAGGSLRRSWLMALFGCLGTLTAFCLFVASAFLSGGLYSSAMPFLILLSTALVILPPTYIRFFYPSMQAGIVSNLTSSETFLLAAFSRRFEFDHWIFAEKRVISTIVGPLCAVLVTQFVMRKAARPTASKSLATILKSIADILQHLASSLRPDISSSTYTFVARSPYPQLSSVFSPPSSRYVQELSAEDLLTKLRELSSLPDSAVSKLDQQYCQTLMGSIKKSQELLSKQKELIQSARQEISWKPPHRFPVNEYTAVLDEIRHLFFHIASLVFALNLYVSPSPDYQFHRSKSALSKLHRSSSESEWPKPTGIDLWSQIEGDMIGTVAKHLGTALRCVGDCLEMRKKIDNSVRIELEKATRAISEVNAKGQLHRVAFERVVLKALDLDLNGEWYTEDSLDWTSAISISPSDFLRLNENDELTYWDAYWLGRDRISTSSSTLTTLKDGLLRLCNLVDDYVASGPQADGSAIIQLLP